MLDYIKKIFQMKEKVINYFINDLDNFINKIINISKLCSNFKPSVVVEEDKLPESQLINDVTLIDDYLKLDVT